jgi:thioredoxin-related protein
MHSYTRYIYTVLLILVSFFSCKENSNDNVSAQGINPGTKWEKINTGMDNIKKMKKPALIFFYTDWCLYCTKMTSEVFNDPEISQYLNENFISMKINPEKDNDLVDIMGEKISASKLMAYTGSRGYPTTLFWDKNKKPVTTVPGYIQKKTFLQILKYLKHECYEQNISINDYMNKPELCRIKQD